MLSTSEQVELLRALAPSLRHTEVLWIAAGLHWYGERDDRNGFLTFEEMAESLVFLARVKGGEGGAGSRDASPTRVGNNTYPQRGGGGGGFWPQGGPMGGGYGPGPYDGSGGGYGPHSQMMGSMGPWAGSMSPGGGLGWGMAPDQMMGGPLSPHPAAREAGAAYYTWIHDNRQKVLER